MVRGTVSRRDLLRVGVWPKQVEVAAGLTIHPREAWATDRVPTGAISEEEVRFLVVHHSAGSTQHQVADVPAVLQGYFDYHTGQKKWPDIAYNFLIDRFGGVWEGRSGSLAGPVAGDATGGNQGFSQLVCLIGDFTHGSPTAAAIDSLERTLAFLADRYEIDSSTDSVVRFVSRGSNRWSKGTEVTTPAIAGHRDMSQTECPGDALYPFVRDELTARVHRLRSSVAAVSPATAPSPPPAPSTSIAANSSTPSSATSDVKSVGGVVRLNPSRTMAGAGLGAVAALIIWRERRLRKGS